MQRGLRSRGIKVEIFRDLRLSRRFRFNLEILIINLVVVVSSLTGIFSALDEMTMKEFLIFSGFVVTAAIVSWIIACLIVRDEVKRHEH